MTAPAIDSKVPPDLFLIQKWFGSIITRPIDSESRMNPISPSGRLMVEEAKEYILPGPKLSSAQRIQIYNQQYWWRLLSILHQNFPMVTRLFGYQAFNLLIGMPFLSTYPSRHWSLSKLGGQLQSWIDQYYNEGDKELIYHAAEIDWAYQAVFFAPPPVDFDSVPDLISKKLMLQPHVQLFKLPFDLFSFRSALLKEEVDYWTETDFPGLPKGKTYYFLLHRLQNYEISSIEIEEGQWSILQMIANGLSIEEACEHLEKAGGKGCEEAMTSLHLWIMQWVKEKWLCRIDKVSESRL